MEEQKYPSAQAAVRWQHAMISDAIYMTTSRPTFHVVLCTLQLIHRIYRGCVDGFRWLGEGGTKNILECYYYQH